MVGAVVIERPSGRERARIRAGGVVVDVRRRSCRDEGHIVQDSARVVPCYRAANAYGKRRRVEAAAAEDHRIGGDGASATGRVRDSAASTAAPASAGEQGGGDERGTDGP